MTRRVPRQPVSRRNVVMGAAATLAAAPARAGSGQMRTASAVRGSRTAKFDRERFVEDCIGANRGSDAQAAVKEVLARAVSQHGAVLAALGEPREAGLDVLHHSPNLTIFAAKWTPQMYLVPHDHRMWALIGIYTGREDNILWRRKDGGIEARGVATLFEGDVAALPADAIHSVTNPLPRFTGGIHIYGGDFFHTARSQWDAETLAEEPSDGDVIREMFARENQRFSRCRDL